MRPSHSNRAPVAASVLLVDDNPDGISARATVLQELGYRVVPSHDGTEALACMEQETFDLVITDYKMKPMDGLELIRNMRNRGQTTPVILLSGFAETLGLNPETTGADAVLQKNAGEVPALVRHVRRLLAPRKKPMGLQDRSKKNNVRVRGN